MITKEQAYDTVYGLMRKEGMIIWQAEGHVDGASAVFSGADVVGDKLAAVPVVITGAETGSHAIDRGASLPEVQATLGHSNVATTSGYLHARPNSSSGLKLDPGVFDTEAA